MKNIIYKSLCDGAWAIPPSPMMKSNGNNYYTCSECGKPTNDPDVEIKTDGCDTLKMRPPMSDQLEIAKSSIVFMEGFLADIKPFLDLLKALDYVDRDMKPTEKGKQVLEMYWREQSPKPFGKSNVKLKE